MAEHTDFPAIATERLLLRPWRESDREAFAEMCADPRVMEFLTPLSNQSESDAFIARVMSHWAHNGFGIFALEERATGRFAGAAGLKRADFQAHFTPAVEIAWRLPFACWGKGLASEAARACLAFGFRNLGLAEIVAYTAPANLRSQAVMTRLGMKRDPDGDFLFPDLPADHPFQPCVLYRLPAAAYHGSSLNISGGDAL